MMNWALRRDRLRLCEEAKLFLGRLEGGDVYKEIIEGAHAIQKKNLTVIGMKKNGDLDLGDLPPTKESGLYWIYTSYTDQDLLKSSSSQQRGAISFSKMARFHSELKHLCHERVGDFRVVYNGKGGTGPKGHGGLRERILEEFRGGDGTGALAIVKSSLKNLDKWRFSYVLWHELRLREPYEDCSEAIERGWRLHYGWPILCSK